MEEISEKSFSKTVKASFTTVKPVSVTDALNSAGTLANMGGSGRIDPKYIATGNYYGQQSLGGQKVQIDSSGGRIMISDDSNKRFIAGAKAT